MSLRMVDFACRKCSFKLEELMEKGDDRLPICPHCSLTMARRPGAPAIKFVQPGFHPGLGRHIRDAQHRDRILKETGMEIAASQNDRARLIEMPSIEEQGERERKKAMAGRLEAIAQKTESELWTGGYLQRGELPARLEEKVRKAGGLVKGRKMGGISWE